MVSVTILVGVDGVPAVVVSVVLLVGSVVSLQKLASVLFPCRWEREKHWYKCNMFNLAHLHGSFTVCMQLYKE